MLKLKDRVVFENNLVLKFKKEIMNLFVNFGVLAIFVLTWNADCNPTFYSKRVTSTNLGDGYTDTITETDNNGRREVYRSRSLGEPEQLHFGLENSFGQHRIHDLNHRFLPPPPFDSDFYRHDFGLNSIDRDPIKLRMPQFDESFPSFGELSSRFNRIDDPFERDFISQSQQLNALNPHVVLPTFSNNIGNDQYSIHKKGFSSSINVNGQRNHKAGATTTINDNGRTATYTVGDTPDITPIGTNYF